MDNTTTSPRPATIGTGVPDHSDFLVIGNSAAGIAAVQTLRAACPQASISLLSSEPHPAYGRPLISYLIEGKTDYDHLTLREPDFYETHRIDTLFGADGTAVGLDADAHTVTLAGGRTISYGKCLVATGSRPFVPPVEGLEGCTNVFTFNTLDDAEALWADARAAADAAHAQGRPMRAAVAGSGPTGIMAAVALSHLADQVDVLGHSRRILKNVVDDEGAACLERQYLPHGIVCHNGAGVYELLTEDVEGAKRARGIRLESGEEFPCDVVVMAVGVRPATELAAQAGAEVDRGLVVDERLQTSLPDVYAAGDVITVFDRLSGTRHPMALWPLASEQGRIAAQNMAGVEGTEPYTGAVPVNAFDFFDISLASAGVVNPPEDAGYDVQAECDGDVYRKTVVRDGKLVGFVLVNDPDDAGIYTAMINRDIPLAGLSDEVRERNPINLDFSEQARWTRLHKGYPEHFDQYGRDLDKLTEAERHALAVAAARA